MLVGVGLILGGGLSLSPYMIIGVLLVIVSAVALAFSFQMPKAIQAVPLAPTTPLMQRNLAGAEQNRNRAEEKSQPAMMEQRSSPVLRPLFRIFKVSNTEDLVKRLLKLVFTVVLLIPLFLLPLYFFFYTLLHL